MTFEVELKARLRRPGETEARAAELGVFEKETFKEDIYFRRQGDTQLIPKDRYRLRREGKRAVVTFKEKVIADEVDKKSKGVILKDGRYHPEGLPFRPTRYHLRTSPQTKLSLAFQYRR